MATPGVKKFADIAAIAKKKPILRPTAASLATPPKKLETIITELKKGKEEENKGCCSRFIDAAGDIYRLLELQYLIFLIVLVLYAFLGAGLFYWCEHDQEMTDRKETIETLGQNADNLTATIMERVKSGASDQEIKALIVQYQEDASLYPRKMVNWDLWGSMFYASTLFTTIGYGHYAPATTAGRITTMIYSLIGIPLVLATLADLGKFLAKVFKKIWTLMRKLWRKTRKGLHEGKMKMAQEHDNELEAEAWRKWAESEEFEVPITVALLILIVWIFFCSAIFCIWEDWTYFKAIYFFFISLTTIGLGDVTPDYPKIMMANFLLVIFGLALISMLINVIQNKINELKEKAEDFLEDELGWDTETDSEDDMSPGESGSRKNSDDQGPTTLGIFQSWGKKSSQEHTHSKTDLEKGDKDERAAMIMAKWKKRVKRRRRGVQTNESWLREAKRRHPEMRAVDLPSDDMKSRDDVNSLIEELDIAQKLTSRKETEAEVL